MLSGFRFRLKFRGRRRLGLDRFLEMNNDSYYFFRGIDSGRV